MTQGPHKLLVFRFRILANVNSSSCSIMFVVCLSSVTFVRPTQTIEIFGNVSIPFGIMAMTFR